MSEEEYSDWDETAQQMFVDQKRENERLRELLKELIGYCEETLETDNEFITSWDECVKDLINRSNELLGGDDG